jgi:ADP-heptose:LPS heptosyltransferase
MQILKPVELGLRRLVVRLLRKTTRREALALSVVDFEHAKVLFLRLHRIGDLLVTLPILNSLKRHYPNLVIDVLLSVSNSGVLLAEPSIRKQYTLKKGLLSILNLVKLLRQEKYDFVIDAADETSTTATLLCLLTKARYTAGFEKENAYVYSIRIHLPSQKEYHVVDRLARILTVFGIDPSGEDLRLRYGVLPANRLIATRFFDEKYITDQRKLGINISAGSESRFWGIENFSGFIDSFGKHHPDWSITLLCTLQDYTKAERLNELCPDCLLAPPTEQFNLFAAFVGSMDLILTPDTSAVHLAAAFNIPSVVLYVHDRPDLMPWTPYKSPSESVTTHKSDLSDISVETVLNAVERLTDREVSK